MQPLRSTRIQLRFYMGKSRNLVHDTSLAVTLRSCAYTINWLPVRMGNPSSDRMLLPLDSRVRRQVGLYA